MTDDDEHPGDSPKPTGDGPERLLHGVRRRFLRHDPLPFLSAGFLLAGMWLVSRDLGTTDWLRGKLALDLVTQLYELCLIGGVAVLVRAGRLRPAAILALLESFFLIDGVFNTAVMPHLGGWAWWVSATWLVAALLKASWLAKILRLKLSREAWGAVLVALVSVSMAPQLLDDLARPAAQILHSFTCWAFCIALGLVARQAIDLVSVLAPDDAARRRIARCGRGAFGLWAIVFVVHSISWMVIFDLNFSLGLYLAPVAGLLVGVRSELEVWVALAFAAPVTVAEPAPTPMTAMFVSLLLGLLIWRAGALRCTRLLVPALGGVWWLMGLIPWFRAPGGGAWLAHLVLFVALVAVAWLGRDILAALVACVPVVLLTVQAIRTGRFAGLSWGWTFVVIGFVLLGAGIVAQVRWGNGETQNGEPAPGGSEDGAR